MTVANHETHFRTCNLCEALCGIEIETENGTIHSIRGDKADQFSRGHICPKAVALQDIQYDANRLKGPVRRTKDGWEPIEWEAAFDEVASRLKEIQHKHGRHAVAVYQGNPTVHNYGSLLFGPGFIRSLHTRNRFSATSVDQLAHHFAAYFLFGHQLLIPIPDLDKTSYLLILGANPAVSNGSLMSAPDIATRLKEIRTRGGKVVLVDPRRTETASLADRHLFIRPKTDALLLLALLHTLFAERLVRPGRLEAFTDGIPEIQRIVQEYSPGTVESACGIPAAQIREVAREFAAAPAAACYGRIGVSTQEYGGICQWLISVINIVTGNLDRPGGVLFTSPAFDVVNAPESVAPKGRYNRWQSRVRKLPEFGGELPVAALAEEILTEGPGQIKALVTSAGNPVLSTPNGRKLDDALSRLEFQVSIDFYINETTRHAHIILPPTPPLEHDNYDLAFHFLAIRNTSKYSPALFRPPKDARHDWEIFLELQTRMNSRNLASSLSAQLQRQALRLLGPRGLLNLGLWIGPYGPRITNPRGLTLGRLKKSPHGVDLGPLQPCLPQRLVHKSRRIQLAPEIFLNDVHRLGKLLEAPQGNLDSELLLIGRRNLLSNNSWMHNSKRLVKGREQCTMMLHPQDAVRLKIANGQRVRVTSRTGSIELEAEVTDSIVAGTASIPHGWGHDRPGVLLDHAVKNAGASINDVTDDFSIDALCGTAAFNGTLIRIEAL